MSSDPFRTNRRGFVAGLAGAATLGKGAAALGEGTAAEQSSVSESEPQTKQQSQPSHSARIDYPRVFSGRQLGLIAFPLGGIGAGSISLGGRGQLRDWEIYNRPDKGRSPEYAFASLHVSSGSSKPLTHVLEAELMPPYASTSGLGPSNAPGLSRLEAATFTGEFPLARVDFRDSRLPVRVSLEAFSPFIPLDPEASGYPAAVLRYRVRNVSRQAVTASIAFSLDNPIGAKIPGSPRPVANDGRVNEYRGGGSDALQGLYMTNPAAPDSDPQKGSFALAVLGASDGRVSYLRGWPAAKWWASPMLFWDDFSQDGELGPEADRRNSTGAICLRRNIQPGAAAAYTFLLAWHFPNRTAAWSGWVAPKGHENDIIGNYYCTQYADAWAAAQHLADHLPELEKRTGSFVAAMRSSTLPGALRDAAVANLSTLVTQTSFRTSDGEFHGFEGCNDQRGCCFGNCTHVWNYETTTQFLFPSLARSLRKAAFGFSQAPDGGMRFRQMLPDGIDRFGYAAADGQMGQIIKTYLDWKQCGDTEWLRGLWPKIRNALAFAWIPGGWDPNRDGVMEGVQHNTYDVEFYGPNPLCGIYYLGAFRAAEEIARVLGETNAAEQYRALFEKGRHWIDANLFNGEYYIQQVRSLSKSQIAPSTVGDMGADRPEQPEFQLGQGCLADQLIGQYLADIAELGPLVNPDNIRKTLQSIRKYNYRQSLVDHDSVQRIYALNDESAILICDYGKGTRPRIPFPYYAEAWTGIEYLVATQFLYAGMLREGLETIQDVRKRFDGERRNPWDEPECGHHYARAMSAWSTLVAFSGFHYTAATKLLSLLPRGGPGTFRCLWSTAGGWGLFTSTLANGRRRTEVSVAEGSLPLQSMRLSRSGAATSVMLNGKAIEHETKTQGETTLVEFSRAVVLSGDARIVAIT